MAKKIEKITLVIPVKHRSQAALMLIANKAKRGVHVSKSQKRLKNKQIKELKEEL